ncbi:MAG: hypothetical protein J1F40_05645 [Prevotellaceae bacterium]|nr:hypothetical protein [Prevotellaceae bacterium]
MKKEYVKPTIWVRNVNVKSSMLSNSISRKFDETGTQVNGARNTTGLFGGSDGDISLDYGIGVDKATGDDIWGGL